MTFYYGSKLILNPVWSNNATQLLISDPGQPRLTRQKNCWSIKLFVGGRGTRDGRRPELVDQNILDLVSASCQFWPERNQPYRCSEVSQLDVDLLYYMRLTYTSTYRHRWGLAKWLTLKGSVSAGLCLVPCALCLGCN